MEAEEENVPPLCEPLDVVPKELAEEPAHLAGKEVAKNEKETRVTMGSFLAETMRHKVNKQVRDLSCAKLSIYSTVQLAKEIEVFKKQERSLIA